MLRVTVMMFRDMVESVMLLNDEDWRGRRRKVGGRWRKVRGIKHHKPQLDFNQVDGRLHTQHWKFFQSVQHLTLSILEALGFRRRRRCRLIRWEELCSVELLNLNMRTDNERHWKDIMDEALAKCVRNMFRKDSIKMKSATATFVPKTGLRSWNKTSSMVVNKNA